MDKVVINLENIDVEGIMAQIHENLKTRGYDLDELKGLNEGLSIPSLKETPALSNAALSSVLSSMGGAAGIQYWWPMDSQPGIFGGIKVFFKKVIRKLSFFYMKHTWEQQILFNNASVRGAGALAGAMEALERENNELHMKITGLKNDNLVLQSSLQRAGLQLEETYDTLSKRLDGLLEDLETQKSESMGMGTALMAKLRRIEKGVAEYSPRLEQNHEPAENQDSTSEVESSELPFDYFLFESRFRGDSAEIMERQRCYLEYFKEGPVVDIGCGRGEFLALLKNQGIEAVGVELSKENFHCCTEQELPVLMGDGIAYLEGCEEGSLGGVFGAQVAEHLTLKNLSRLFASAYKALKPGGVLILETLNPQCLMIFAESFYLDPSHEKPLHPLTMRFMAEYQGFLPCELVYKSPSDPNLNLKPIKGSESGTEAVNKLLFGPREYALVAYKPEESAV